MNKKDTMIEISDQKSVDLVMAIKRLSLGTDNRELNSLRTLIISDFEVYIVPIFFHRKGWIFKNHLYSDMFSNTIMYDNKTGELYEWIPSGDGEGYQWNKLLIEDFFVMIAEYYDELIERKKTSAKTLKILEIIRNNATK
jgi:hypothetical protein